MTDVTMRAWAWWIPMVACGLAAATGGQARAPDRPNILFILSDDQAAGLTGFEGHPLIQTPHLDKLAEEGTFFSRCYVPTPQCAPSRAVIMTGQYPHTHGITTNGTEERPMALSPRADTFTARLHRAGYTCGIVGKWHLPYATSEAPGFGLVDYVATDDHPWQWEECPVFVNGERKTADRHLTHWHADRAIEFLETRTGDAPFFLWLSFRTPHAPLVYPPETGTLYPPEEVGLPATMDIVVQDQWPNILLSALPHEDFKKLRASPDFEDELRRRRSKYYAMITDMDRAIGRVLDKLDKLGMADDTVVVFTSDNGWAIGDHQLFAKGPFFYEELVRMPLLVRYPRLARAGLRIERITSFVDLAPTFLDLAGERPPITMHGRSLVPLLRDPSYDGHPDEAFFEYDEHKGTKYVARGVVNRRYKLIDYQAATERFDVLYDLERDPEERHNVIRHPAYEPVVRVLRSRLATWQEQTRDPLRK